MLSTLSKSIALHSVCVGIETYLDVYNTVLKEATLVSQFDSIKAEELSEQQATEIILQLHAEDPEDLFHKLLSEFHGPQSLVALKRWREAAFLSPVVQLCREKSKARTNRVEKNVGATCKDVLLNTIGLNMTEDGLARLTHFNIEGDIAGALNILRTLPCQSKLYYEIQFVAHFGKVAKTFAGMTVWYNSKQKRCDRQLKEAVRQAFSSLRSDMKVFETFYETKIVGHVDVFKSNVADLLTHTASIGNILDLGPLPATLKAIKKWMETILADLCKDCSDISKLIVSRDIVGWELQKDKIMENNDLVAKLVVNPNYGRCGKACGLLKEWRTLLKAINPDGNGVCVSTSHSV